MDKRSYHGPDFEYKVSWREAGGTSVHWNHHFAKSPPFFVNNTGTYTPFEITVQAVNSLGEGPAPEPEIGHSGEDSTSLPSTLQSSFSNRRIHLYFFILHKTTQLPSLQEVKGSFINHLSQNNLFVSHSKQRHSTQIFLIKVQINTHFS